MTPQQRKQEQIAQIRSLQEAISAEKSAIEQLMKTLHTLFNARWPTLTIHSGK
jgi:hypothetical protein